MKSADEAPASDFATIFQPAEGDQQLSPARQHALAHQQFAEHYTITFQQHRGSGLQFLAAVFTVQRMQQ